MSRKRPRSCVPDCSICEKAYDLNDKFPVVGTCGHSICSYCFQRFSSCPICKRKSAFDIKAKNFDLIEFMEYEMSKNNKPPKPPKNCVFCFNCSKLTNEEDCFVCLDCVDNRNHGYFTWEEVMELVDDHRMCSECAQTVGVHAGHDAIHQLNKIKSNLRSMNRKMNNERQLENVQKEFKQMESAFEIARHSYLHYFETCVAKGRMSGSEVDFIRFDMGVDNNRLHLNTVMLQTTRCLWEFTKECLNVTKSMAVEKKRLQAREFEPSEEERCLALTENISAQDVGDSDIPQLHLSEWKKMMPVQQRWKAHVMTRDSDSSSDEREDEEEAEERGQIEDEEETEARESDSSSDESEDEEETEESEDEEEAEEKEDEEETEEGEGGDETERPDE